MKKVTVKYLGNFSLITRKRREKITLEEEKKLGDLINKLSQKYGKKLSNSLTSEATTILVNGSPKDKNTTLHDGDELVITTLVGGG
jgi:MoaD family protein